jgi:AcrR family transcriptional regulator
MSGSGAASGERHRRILDAAAEAFHEKGFHGVSVDEIGRRSGLSGPALYRHFAGKDEILATLLDEAMDELMTATEPVHGDPARDLDRALRQHVAFALAHRQLVSLHRHETRSLADPWATDLARRTGRYTRRWEALLARRFPAAAPEEVAAATQACLGMLFSVSGWPDRALQTPDVADVLLRLLTGGLQALDGRTVTARTGSPTSTPRSGGTAARRNPP